MLGTTMLGAGSLVCKLTANAAMLIVGRAIAGLGAALEVPTSLAILTVAYHPRQSDHRQRDEPVNRFAQPNKVALGLAQRVSAIRIKAIIGTARSFRSVEGACDEAASSLRPLRGTLRTREASLVGQ